jgi:hypothetical protein
MEIHTLQYKEKWAKEGRHLFAQYDVESIIVYQAYRPSIADAAVAAGKFGGGGYGFSRMSWIKPSFLWMMYRSGWGTKEGQERILALRLRRSFFDDLLARAVESTRDPGIFANEQDWQQAIETSDVRVQWDPDRDPFGAPLELRTIQIGLRGPALRALGSNEDLLEVIDMTPFVEEQREVLRQDGAGALQTPYEGYYPALSSAHPAFGSKATSLKMECLLRVAQSGWGRAPVEFLKDILFQRGGFGWEGVVGYSWEGEFTGALPPGNVVCYYFDEELVVPEAQFRAFVRDYGLERLAEGKTPNAGEIEDLVRQL